jgi:hypothetical protein
MRSGLNALTYASSAARYAFKFLQLIFPVGSMNSLRNIEQRC